MAVIKVDEQDPVGELEPSFPFRDVKIMHNVDVRDYYDLKEEIGRGKFGTVYRCVEKKSGIVLAAKFVAIAKKQDRINVEREVEIMRTLQHPRLIQLYDSFEIHNVMCVVLEMIEGGELFERVIDDDFILTEKACSVFMRQICEGVSFIHINKIIHLDLKPENILCLTKTGNRIKIIDFGLARKYDPNKKLQVLFGTPEFVAPEVVNFDEITTATDMWSVGVICYVLLSGLSPFMGENDLQTMTNVTMAQYDFDDEAFDSISNDAKDFISKLLVKNKESRLTAGSCLSHPWLKRKPPPPPMFLETSKENLKTYVDNNHSSSPFLLVDALSNGSITSQLTEIVPEKSILKVDEKAKNIINLTPEFPSTFKDTEKALLEKQNVQLKNEINLEKSTNPSIMKQEPSLGHIVKPQLPAINVLPNTKCEETENVNRKVTIKTDSFKELPRKFSVTVSDGSRELPRRSSLTRADKAKNEIKRETFVSFIGPKEIKPIDPLSPEVKTAVEELTKFIKSNIEEVSEVRSRKDDIPSIRENKFVEAIKKEHFIMKEEKSKKEPFNMTEEKSKIKKDEACSFKESMRNEVFVSEEISTSSVAKMSIMGQLPPNPKHTHSHTVTHHQEQARRHSEIPSLLRPNEYLKFSNKTKDTVQPSSGLSEVKLYDPSKCTDKSINTSIGKKSNVNHPYQNILTSYTKEVSYSKLTDNKETLNSSRNQSLYEINKKPTDKTGKNAVMSNSTDNSDNINSKLKSGESFSLKTWHSTAMRNDLTLPRKFTHGIKYQECTDASKENTFNPTDPRNSRATSLDPSSAGCQTSGNHEQPFQSRFLRSSLFKPESSFRCSSEAPTNKYEDFRSRYSNYKELAMDNDKLFKRGIDRTLPRKKETTEDPPTPGGHGNPGDSPAQNINSPANQSSSTSHSLSSTSYLSRQKFKFTDQQRDVPFSFIKSNKNEATSSSFRMEKDSYRYTSSSGLKESSSQKHSLNSSQSTESKSKSSLTEKCPPTSQKSM